MPEKVSPGASCTAVGVQGKIALGVVLGVGHQHQVRQHAVGIQLRRASRRANG